MYKDERRALSVLERVKLDDLLLIQLQTVQLPFITFFAFLLANRTKP